MVEKRFNPYKHEIKRLKTQNQDLLETYAKIGIENEQLKKQIQDCEFAHRTEMAHHRVVEKELKEKNEQLKQQIKDLQAKNDSIEWLRNNTAWEQIPSIIRTSISTNTVENPYCDKRKVNKR